MRKPKSLPDKRRRLTQREESAVALIALRMVVGEREWNPGDAPVVRMLDMMFRALEYQIAAKAFGAWLTRLGIQTLRRGGRKLVVVPVNFDEAEAALRKLTGSGHTLASAVKGAILAQAVEMTTATGPTVNIAGAGRGPIPVCPAPAARNQEPHEEGAVKAGHGVWGNVEHHPDQEIGSTAMGDTDRSICGSTPKPFNDAAKRQSTMGLPPEPRKPLNDFLDEEED